MICQSKGGCRDLQPSRRRHQLKWWSSIICDTLGLMPRFESPYVNNFPSVNPHGARLFAAALLSSILSPQAPASGAVSARRPPANRRVASCRSQMQQVWRGNAGVQRIPGTGRPARNRELRVVIEGHCPGCESSGLTLFRKTDRMIGLLLKIELAWLIPHHRIMGYIHVRG